MSARARSEVDPERQLRELMFGTEFGDAGLKQAMASELRERLREGRPLRVYAGYDPTAPDLHLGHTLSLRKLRQFQDFGHEVIFLIGTLTAEVGDASDKLSGRPQKTPEEVAAAATSYAEQCFTILDRERTQVVRNGDWLRDMTLANVIGLASQFTVQQFLVRDNYRKRFDAGNPIGLHEFFYALLQGYDAVHLRADVQIGATEQLFNIQAGRKLQQVYGQKPCVCLTTPILVGLDGRARMSKSTGNYVGIREAPEDQFGKTMSISDETLAAWIPHVSGWSLEEIEASLEGLRTGKLHPMEEKKRLARAIVTQFHGAEAAASAQTAFESLHQHRQLPDDMPEIELSGAQAILELLPQIAGVGSKGEARRLLRGRGVKVDGETVEEPTAMIDRDCIVQVGKRRFARVRVLSG